MIQVIQVLQLNLVLEGGSGNARYAFNVRGGHGTIFSGGAGSGNADHCGHSGHSNPYRAASDYGGAGSPVCGVSSLQYTVSGGVGNPNGAGASFPSGTGGLLLIFVRENIIFGSNGLLTVKGVNYLPSGRGSGASGGGIVSLLYSGELINYTSSKINANGGSSPNYGGAGGPGSIIGPIKIAKGPGPCNFGELRINGVCQTYGWVGENDWTSCSRECGDGIQYQNISCKAGDGTLLDDSFCQDLAQPSDSRTCNKGDCIWELGSWSGCNKVKIYAGEDFRNWSYVTDDEEWRLWNTRDVRCKRDDGIYLNLVECGYSLGSVNYGGACCPTFDIELNEYRKKLDFSSWTYSFGTNHLTPSACKSACYNELGPNPSIGGKVLWLLSDEGSNYYCICSTTAYSNLELDDYSTYGGYSGEDYPHSYAGCAEP